MANIRTTNFNSKRFQGINYQCFGDPEKSAVLFFHGFLGDSRDWQQVVDLVSEHSYCITIDLPGHGNSNIPDLLKNLWDFESFSLKIDEFLKNLLIEKINLVGYSMGGRLAQYFAINYPKRVLKLVLESSSPGIKNKKERISRLERDKVFVKRLQDEPLIEILNTWYKQSLFQGIRNHPQYAEMVKKRSKNNPQLMAKALMAFSTGNQPYLAEKISAVGIPVLLLCGEKDSKYLKIMKELKHNNPGYKLNVMDKCGHNTHFEKPILFAEHLLEFLSL